MIVKREFLKRAGLEEKILEVWIEAGWLRTDGERAAPEFSDIDLARARLIRELTNDMSVNEDGVGIVLDLLDQVHGLRLKLRQVAVAISLLPKDRQVEIAAAHCEVCSRHETPAPRSGPRR